MSDHITELSGASEVKVLAVPDEAQDKIQTALEENPRKLFKSLFVQEAEELCGKVKEKYSPEVYEWMRYDTSVITEAIDFDNKEVALDCAKTLVEQNQIENVSAEEIVSVIENFKRDLDNLEEQIEKTAKAKSVSDYYNQAVVIVDEDAPVDLYLKRINQYNIAKTCLEKERVERAEKKAFETELFHMLYKGEKRRKLQASKNILNTKLYPTILREDNVVRTALGYITNEMIETSLKQKSDERASIILKVLVRQLYNWREIWLTDKLGTSNYRVAHPPIDLSEFNASELDHIADLINNYVIDNDSLMKKMPKLKLVLQCAGLLKFDNTEK